MKIAGLALAVWVAGCQSGEIVGGPDLPESTSAEGSGWGVGQSRSPLGIAGKPVVEMPTGPVIGDELLVRFADGTTVEDQTLAVASANGVIVYRGQRSGYTVVRFASIDATARATQTLRADLRVVDAIYNHIVTGSGPSTSPSRELGLLQWNLHAMQLDPFNYRYEADGVLVAVLDTGVAYEDFADALGTYQLAPDLSGVEFVAGYDFVNDDDHPNDDQRHGTHVTGVIAASSGISALAPGVAILPVKVLDGGNSGTELALAEGLQFAADQGARVANMSLSFPPTYFPSRLMQRAVDYAAQRGVVMVAAAGNHGEGLVAYPAAFRDVIAVGASALPEDWVAPECDEDDEEELEEQWEDTLDVLVRAPYSNRGWKLDVLAPGGRIPSDANGDGKPEAIVAQTFATGDPTDFDYYFYAGTSQSAAQVSALAAVMIFENPELDAHDVRALLIEEAKSMSSMRGRGQLDVETGMGAVRAKKSVKASRDDDAADDRPRFFANVAVTLHDTTGGNVVAVATVEILDAQGKPSKNTKVYGMFTGAAFATVAGTTNSQGVVTFVSDPLAANMIVAFQVDAVSRGKGKKRVFDRPLGFLRIDSVSLELLATFGQGVSTSPSGVSTSPSDSSGSAGPSRCCASGSGPSTSPSIPLPTDPALTPISIAYDPALFAGTNYRPTLLLPNFSWGLSTVPMAVAVDEAWFLATFPGAADRRVLSLGSGVGASPLLFDADSSFPVPVVIADPTANRIALVVMTFTSGVSTSPSGVSTSPSGVSTSPSSIWVERQLTSIDAALADGYESVIDGWYASAAGVSTSPSFTPGAYPFGAAVFDHLTAMTNAYILFAPLDVASPSTAYIDTLSAGSLPVAPVPPDADGEGQGIERL